MGKAFEKQMKTIEDQEQKQVEALQNLKSEEQTKAIEAKSNNQSIAASIFNDLINKRKSILMTCMKVLIRINYILSMYVLLRCKFL